MESSEQVVRPVSENPTGQLVWVSCGFSKHLFLRSPVAVAVAFADVVCSPNVILKLENMYNGQ